jgi:damage-control phosphatase, subfamily I
MLLTPDCIPCIVRASLAATREITPERSTLEGLLTDILRIPALRGLDWSLTSVHVLELVLETITSALGNPDPFRLMKERQNQRGLQLFPVIKGLVDESHDSLSAAINLSIIGNWIDVMWTEGATDMEQLLRKRLQVPVPSESITEFKQRVERCNLLVYLGDNSGEVVFDRILIETLRKQGDLEIVFVTRSVPTLNDVTLLEAETVGMHEVCTVVPNGIDGPVPGTILSRCSSRVRDLIERSDLIFSKGGGNFDSFEEEREHLHKTYFALMSKCIPYRDYFKTDLHRPILATCNRADPEETSTAYQGYC